MSKLSLSKSGIEARNNIKDDAMRPTLCLVSIVLFFITLVLIFCNNSIIRYCLLVLFFIAVLSAIYINIFFAHKDPDRLHTENYLINKQIVAAGLLEDKTVSRIKQNCQELLTSDIITIEDEGDKND